MGILSDEACKNLFDNSIEFLTNVNKQLAVVVSRADRISAKLGKLAGSLDLAAWLAKFPIPQIHLLTVAEYIDLILGCPILVCVMPGAQIIINWLTTYIADHGAIDPNNPPPEVYNKVVIFVELANVQAKRQQALACLMLAKALARSPLGSIARLKEGFDTFIKLSGIHLLVSVTSSTLNCLISNYPDSASNPSVIAYNSLLSQIGFDPEGNVQTMTDENQIIMNDCSQRRADLAELSLGA